MLTPVDLAREMLEGRTESLQAIAAATGLSERSLQMIVAGLSPNANTRAVVAIAAHFGYRFVAVPMNAPGLRGDAYTVPRPAKNPAPPEQQSGQAAA